MLETDIWTMRLDELGEAELLDKKAHDWDGDGTHYPPDIDPVQNTRLIYGGMSLDGGSGLEFVVTRSLVSSDTAEDNPFYSRTEGGTPIAVAWDDTQNVIQYHNLNKIRTVVDFFAANVDSACSISATVAPAASASGTPSPSRSPNRTPSSTHSLSTTLTGAKQLPALHA